MCLEIPNNLQLIKRSIASGYHPYQPNRINGGEQDIVSQHAKGFTSPGSPSIHSTTKDPNRI